MAFTNKQGIKISFLTRSFSVTRNAIISIRDPGNCSGYHAQSIHNARHKT